jgi:hypothetical protein
MRDRRLAAPNLSAGRRESAGIDDGDECPQERDIEVGTHIINIPNAPDADNKFRGPCDNLYLRPKVAGQFEGDLTDRVRRTNKNNNREDKNDADG